MTILAFVIALFIILVIAWLTYTYMPSTPAPMNFIKWIIYILLVVVLFVMLFNVIGYAPNIFNRRV